jgi:hypothetical protein
MRFHESIHNGPPGEITDTNYVQRRGSEAPAKLPANGSEIVGKKSCCRHQSSTASMKQNDCLHLRRDLLSARKCGIKSPYFGDAQGLGFASSFFP